MRRTALKRRGCQILLVQSPVEDGKDSTGYKNLQWQFANFPSSLTELQIRVVSEDMPVTLRKMDTFSGEITL